MGFKVRLTNQSFREAGGKESFPNLELGDILTVDEVGKEQGGILSAIEAANEELKKVAASRGYVQVFNVEYSIDISGHESHNAYQCRATGTGYQSLQSKK